MKIVKVFDRISGTWDDLDLSRVVNDFDRRDEIVEIRDEQNAVLGYVRAGELTSAQWGGLPIEPRPRWLV